MTDNATSEIQYLLRRAADILRDAVTTRLDPEPLLVEELLAVRDRIEEELKRVGHAEDSEPVSALDEDIRRLRDILLSHCAGSLAGFRKQRADKVLGWWWHLDEQPTSPVEWAHQAISSIPRTSSEGLATLRLGPVAPPTGARLNLPLMKNVQFIYELNLARLELSALNGDPEVEVMSDLRCLRTRHHPDRESELQNRLAYFEAVNMRSTAYFYLQKNYNITRSVNQYLTHWFYPYKGKFHPQVVRALLNILRVAPGATVLDPFSGVGTTALECLLLGIHSVGVDISAVATRVAKAKVEAWKHLDGISERMKVRLQRPPLCADDVANQPLLPGDELCSALGDPDDPIENFFVVAALIACSDTGRRKRDFLTSYQDRCEKMLRSIQLMDKAIGDFDLRAGMTDIRRGDVRRLPMESDSVDAIITSPPYSIALNYVENDRHALEALGLSLDDVKEDYIGVRGSGEGKIRAYEDDMRLAVREMARVLKPGGMCAIIIGNPTHLCEPIKADDLLDGYCQEEGLQIWSDQGLNMSHRIPKTVYGLYNVINVEQILLFSKPGLGAKLLPAVRRD